MLRAGGVAHEPGRRGREMSTRAAPAGRVRIRFEQRAAGGEEDAIPPAGLEYGNGDGEEGPPRQPVRPREDCGSGFPRISGCRAGRGRGGVDLNGGAIADGVRWIEDYPVGGSDPVEDFDGGTEVASERHGPQFDPIVGAMRGPPLGPSFQTEACWRRHDGFRMHIAESHPARSRRQDGSFGIGKLQFREQRSGDRIQCAGRPDYVSGEFRFGSSFEGHLGGLSDGDGGRERLRHADEHAQRAGLGDVEQFRPGTGGDQLSDLQSTRGDNAVKGCGNLANPIRLSRRRTSARAADSSWAVRRTSSDDFVRILRADHPDAAHFLPAFLPSSARDPRRRRLH